MMKRSLTRRGFLAASGVVAAGVAGITLGCQSDIAGPIGDEGPGPEAPDDLAASPRMNAAAASLVVATNAIKIAGRNALQPVTYNGLACGPTLVARPGSTINLRLTNNIQETQDGLPLSSLVTMSEVAPQSVRGTRRHRRGHHGMAMAGMSASVNPGAGALTNMHFHGMHVPQSGNADNPFLRVASGSTQQYAFQIPSDHPAGLYWYHPHVPGLVTNQLGRGAAGLISIENAFTDRIVAMGIRRRLMQLHQLYFDADNMTVIPDDDNKDDTSDSVALSLINGQLHPRVYMQPGEPQYWAMANTSTTAWYLLSLTGHTFDVVAEDGIPLLAARTAQTQVLIAPAKRIEVIVRATAVTGSYTLGLQTYDQGEDQWPAKPLATVVVAGKAWSGPDAPGVDTSHPLEDLRSASALSRTIHFGEDPSVPDDAYGGYLINGVPFDPNRIDFSPALGSVEEWTVINDSDEEHPFHMHTNQYQLTKVNGTPVTFDGYQDTTRLPRLGSITLRVRFADFTGRTITHCHITDHECNGMMAIVNVAGS
jgi:FtsP/CotA-like multicopper oxidase with cupredoxin domain